MATKKKIHRVPYRALAKARAERMVQSIGEKFARMSEKELAAYVNTLCKPPSKIETAKLKSELVARMAKSREMTREVQEAIELHPTLAAWQMAGGVRWEQATRVDKMLRELPRFKGLPFVDRFGIVIKIVEVMNASMRAHNKVSRHGFKKGK